MDCNTQPGLLPVEDALARIHTALIPLVESEPVILANALDRVLALPVESAVAVPPYDNSAMDGYALRASDSHQPLRIIGQALAGHPFHGALNPGDCVRIMTGAVIPNGADTVVMQENVQASAAHIQLQAPVTPGENIRYAGEDIATGSILFAKGHRLTALDIGLLASVGCAEIRVIRKLRVALLTTGDELRKAGEPLAPGCLYDSNRPLLKALLTRLPVELLDLGIIPDQPEALRHAFQEAIAWADVIISTGGVSVGDADYTRNILGEYGTIALWKIAMKPGKPFAFGQLHQQHRYQQQDCGGWFFGLPGNPVSTAVTFHQLVVPALRHLCGEQVSPSLSLTAIAETPLKKQPGRMDFQRGILRFEQGQYYVRSAGLQSSGVLSTMINANCYIRLSLEQGAIAAGSEVEVVPFDGFIR